MATAGQLHPKHSTMEAGLQALTHQSVLDAEAFLPALSPGPQLFPPRLLPAGPFLLCHSTCQYTAQRYLLRQLSLPPSAVHAV